MANGHYTRIKPRSLQVKVESPEQLLDGETQIMSVTSARLAVELTQVMMDVEGLCWERLIAMTRSEVS
jgi:hypothetical protein